MGAEPARRAAVPRPRGHLRPARKHVERLDVDGEAVDIKLGTFVDNTRRRADKLTPERRTELDQLGMRW
ncbi:helicase associated domain-containing protein [Streptomyces canarius]